MAGEPPQSLAALDSFCPYGKPPGKRRAAAGLMGD
jgi:hypothetical protein